MTYYKTPAEPIDPFVSWRQDLTRGNAQLGFRTLHITPKKSAARVKYISRNKHQGKISQRWNEAYKVSACIFNSSCIAQGCFFHRNCPWWFKRRDFGAVRCRFLACLHISLGSQQNLQILQSKATSIQRPQKFTPKFLLGDSFCNGEPTFKSWHKGVSAATLSTFRVTCKVSTKKHKLPTFTQLHEATMSTSKTAIVSRSERQGDTSDRTRTDSQRHPVVDLIPELSRAAGLSGSRAPRRNNEEN